MIPILNLLWLVSTKAWHTKSLCKVILTPPTNLPAIFWWIIEANSTDCKTTWWKPPWQISVASKFPFLFVLFTVTHFVRLPQKIGCGGGLEGQCATTWWGKTHNQLEWPNTGPPYDPFGSAVAITQPEGGNRPQYLTNSAAIHRNSNILLGIYVIVSPSFKNMCDLSYKKKHIQNQQGIIPSDYARSLENLSFPMCCMGL